ncbi:hypothetical protein Ddc_08142 [Ditylenchus destructor]|nr:hypothetical protein Ddc_08142 [Ditylenchus destructor]
MIHRAGNPKREEFNYERSIMTFGRRNMTRSRRILRFSSKCPASINPEVFDFKRYTLLFRLICFVAVIFCCVHRKKAVAEPLRRLKFSLGLCHRRESQVATIIMELDRSEKEVLQDLEEDRDTIEILARLLGMCKETKQNGAK